ncbi:MAG: hypothetical protein JWP81_4403 [Ferruginibacter sp.]|nr:hypothetical protein [Ferruginibacter sp.]
MIKNKIIFLLCSLLTFRHSFAQNAPTFMQLPVNIVEAANDTSKPLIMYITGDGGWNKFSKTLAVELAAKGCPVISLNARDYFWKKKTAAQTTVDITHLTRYYQRIWRRKKIMLIGYSFGADVMPFVFNLLPPDISSAVVNISLLSPAPYTDFEIHLAAMIGANFYGGESVVAAINKITTKPLTIISGKEEKNFPLQKLTIKNYTAIQLGGGHHYDGDESSLCNTILLSFSKR